jgi:hypothetical protein
MIRHLSNILEEIIYWLMFGLLLSLAPLAMTAWKSMGLDGSLGLLEALKNTSVNGEVLLVSITLLGGTIGTILRVDTEHRRYKGVIGGVSLILFFISTTSYVNISTVPNISLDHIAVTSVATLFGTFWVCMAAIIMPRAAA